MGGLGLAGRDVRLKCKTFTLWQTGGAYVNMPDYAEMPVRACQSVLLGTDDDGSRNTTLWYDVAHIDVLLTSSSERKGPLSPSDLAKETFVPLQ